MRTLLFTIGLWSVWTVSGAALAGPTYADPKATDADFPIQGEYVLKGQESGKEGQWGLHVIAQGKGKFQAVLYPGGLPGAGWDAEKKVRIRVDGGVDGSAVNFAGKDGVSIRIAGGKATAQVGEKGFQGAGEKVERKSPTLGEKPPQGAVVLFDGTSAAAFKGGRMTEDGLLMEGVTSEKTFGSCKLHLEFRLPYQPEDRGQGRGNSGCYLQGRYEVQILDSFGLDGKNNEAGGIYTIKDPAVNMCFPPLVWQTYDVDYTAAEYGPDGKKTKNARMTVRHNGVVVQQDTELPKSTTAAPVAEGPTPGPLHLQNHGNPVRFRNIWLVETK